MRVMPIKKATKKDFGPRVEPLAFRFSEAILKRLRSLAAYGDLTMTDVMETLIAEEYDRISKSDQKGLSAVQEPKRAKRRQT